MTKTKVLKKTAIGQWYSITVRSCTKQYVIMTRGDLGMSVEYLNGNVLKTDWISYYSIERILSVECPIQT